MSGRQALALLLAAVAGLAAIAGASAWWMRDAVVDQSGFADRAAVALEQRAVRDAVEREIVAQVTDRLPPEVPQARVRDVVGAAVASTAFDLELAGAAARFNDELVQGDATATLDVDIGRVLEQTDPELVALLGDVGRARVARVHAADLPVNPARAADLVRGLAAVGPPLAFFALAAALAAARDRRSALGAFGLAALVASLLLFAGLELGRAAVRDEVRGGTGLSTAQARDAAVAAWREATGGVRTVAIAGAAGGLVLAIAGLGPWGRRRGYAQPST